MLPCKNRAEPSALLRMPCSAARGRIWLSLRPSRLLVEFIGGDNAAMILRGRGSLNCSSVHRRCFRGGVAFGVQTIKLDEEEFFIEILMREQSGKAGLMLRANYNRKSIVDQ